MKFTINDKQYGFSLLGEDHTGRWQIVNATVNNQPVSQHLVPRGFFELGSAKGRSCYTGGNTYKIEEESNQ